MTVPAAVTTYRYEGNGVTTVFAYSNRLLTTADVTVQRLTRATDAVVDTLTLTTDYTVTIVSNSLANITITNPAKIPSITQDILLSLNIGLTQTRSFPRADSLPAADIELGLDKLTLIAQLINDDIGRSLRFPASDTTTDGELPARGDRASKFLGFNADGDPVASAGTDTVTSAYGLSLVQAADATAARAVLAAAASGANTDITSLSALVSLNGSGVGGIRNTVTNSGMRFAARGNTAVINGAATYGGCDGWFCFPQSFTTCTGTIQQYTGQGTSTGFAHGALVTTTGTGNLFFGTRIESLDIKHYNSQTATISFYAYQNTGGAVTVIPSLYKPTALDNFASTTLIATGSSVGVPTGVLTRVTQTVTFSSTDVSNGLQIYAQFNFGAVTTKDFYVGDVKIEFGSVATPFLPMPAALDLIGCERILPRLISGGTTSPFGSTGTAASTTDIFFPVQHRVAPRKTPTGITVSSGAHVTVSDAVANTACTAVTLTLPSINSSLINLTVAAGLTQYRPYYAYFNNASGKILFNGCEL